MSSPQDPLNPEQRRAVEHGAGTRQGGPPLIVLAGPGTGKTRVIVHRVSRLILENGVEPESIVAVTFTVKAAEELRHRLRELVGPGKADRVNAGTFHALGLSLLRRFGDVIGVSGPVRLMDPAQRRRLLRELIREHDLFAAWAAAGRDAAIPAAEGTIAALRHAGVTPERAEADARAWLERAERGEVEPASDAGSPGDAVRAERERAARFHETARLYGLFERACRERAALTFDDLIALPARMLATHEGVAAIVRQEWRHTVVDEFQDVNGAQVELLRLIAPPAAPGADGSPAAAPDLCVVGDDDQAIYAFRGADRRAFERFASTWPGHGVIALTRTYRAAPVLVRVTGAVIAAAGRRFAPDKRVEPAEPADRPDAGVELVTLDDSDLAGEAIAAMILADHARDRGRAWGSSAVIARTHGELDRIGAALALEGIPVRRAPGASLLEDEGVRDVLRWCELLTDDRHVSAAHRLLTRPPISVPAAQAGEWARAYARERTLHADDPAGHEDPGPIVPWLERRAPRRDDVSRFAALHRELSALTAALPAAGALYQIVRLTGVSHADLPEAHARAARLSALGGLIAFAQRAAGAMDPPGGLHAFLDYLEDLGADELVAHLDPEGRLHGTDTADDDEDAVALLTAHAAKGLEFDTVYLPRVRPPHGYPKTRRDDRPPEAPPGLLGPGDDEDADEERRVFYVACTRARRRLVLLAQSKKKRSDVEDYFDELWYDEPAAGLVTRRTLDDILRGARSAGVGVGDAPGDGLATPLPGVGGQARRELFARARREARLSAAAALDEAERGAGTASSLDELHRRLRAAAERLAAVAALEAGRAVPAWVREPEALDAARRLDAALARVPGGGAEPGAFEFRALRPPLRLSYSLIQDYERCPRCAYVKHVLRFPEPEGPRAALGIAVHGALERFYDAWRSAESIGSPRPGLADLLRFGEQALRAGAGSRLDPEVRRQALAQLRMVHERLHDPRAEVLEVEKRVQFPYERGGQTHEFIAKIDRIDRLEGGFRIIDYKTGEAWASLRTPRPDDLQLGIYALALAHLFGGGDGLAPSGEAEYWLLSSGERGRIALDSLRLDKVRRRIDRVIDALLAGEFPAGDTCSGACAVLGGPPAPACAPGGADAGATRQATTR